jgi:transposase
MANVMIKCPKTGKLVSTGISMDKKSFDTAKLVNNTVGCPACGGKHVWSKEDAILKD